MRGLKNRAYKACDTLRKAVSSRLRRTVIERLFTEDGYRSNDKMAEVLVNSLMYTKPKRKAEFHLPLAYHAAGTIMFPKGPEETLTSLCLTDMDVVHDLWAPVMVDLEMHHELASSYRHVFNQDNTPMEQWRWVTTTKEHEGEQHEVWPALVVSDEIAGPLKGSPSFAVGGNFKFQSSTGLQEKVDEVEEQIGLYDDAKLMFMLDIERNLNRDQTVEGAIGPTYVWNGDNA